MADPFSIVAGAAGLIEASVSLGKFIIETKKGIDTIDDDLQQLGTEADQLKQAGELIRKVFEDDMKEADAMKKNDDSAAVSLWSAASAALQDGKSVLERLTNLLKSVKGKDGASTLDRLRRHFRRLSKDEEFVQLRQKLDNDHRILQTTLTALNIIVTRQSQAGNTRSIAGLSTEMSAWATKIDKLISSLETNVGSHIQEPLEKDVIAAAKSIKKLAWLNVHFMIPQSVSDHFVGREFELTEVKKAAESHKKDKGTKRIVIYGLNGSGKTQFCCKFARDNRPSFWGVFFINATSSDTVDWSYAQIAKVARIEPIAGNVRHWLSVQTKPWLLIIDNADANVGSYDPQNLIPESETGVVLFTTRNHLLRTLGSLRFKFEGLEEDLSAQLLLTTADRTRPFPPTMYQLAKDICRKFGYLPLAILHAGKAILKGSCTFEDCLDFVERTLARVKGIMESDKPKATGPSGKDSNHGLEGSARTSSETVYATFELVIPAATEDGLQMLRLMSFMQSQQFHFQILLKAIINPRRQAIADKNISRDVPASGGQRRSWDRVLRDIMRKAYVNLEQLGSRPALPSILRSLQNEDLADIKAGLREVLSELRALALLDYNDVDETYSMHSSVQWWIRASMTYQEKQVWCQAACNVLAFGILLPPVGIQDEDGQLRRQAYPHIQYVRKQEKQLADELLKRQEKRKWSWPRVSVTFDRARILRDAKFSLVYAECGMWQESRELMLGVDNYLVGAIGLEDPISIRVRLFLAASYWWLGDPDESLRLQEELLTACQRSLGEEHVETLNVKDRLGTSLWQQGELHKARVYTQQAVDGFRKVYPAGNVDKSRALTSLGRVVGKLAAFDEAVTLNLEALEGLASAEKEQRSEFGDQTLDVMEVLAMARHDRYRYGHPQSDDLREAERLQVQVLDAHTEKLGEEHPKSLWATCNLARIRATMGDLVEAEQMLKKGLPVAERTIGADHLGYLMGKAYLGHVLTLAKKLDEAEVALCSVVEAHRARDGQKMHPDHLVAATLLLNCHRLQEKHQEVDKMEEEILEGIRGIFGPGSPWEYYFVKQYARNVEAGVLQAV